jgi:signal transduction histidine kinase
LLTIKPYMDRVATVGMAVVLVVLTAVGIGGGLVTEQAASRVTESVAQYRVLQQAHLMLNEETLLQREYYLKPSAALRQNFDAINVQVVNQVTAMVSVLMPNPTAAGRAELSDALSAQASFVSASHAFFAATDRGDRLQAVAIDGHQVEPLVAALTQINAAASSLEDRQLAADVRTLTTTEHTVRLVTVAIFVPALLLLLVLGFIFRRYRRSIDEAGRREMQRAVEQAADASEAARAAEAMSAVTAALASSLEPELLYQVILEQAARVLPFDHAMIVLYQDGWVVNAACLGEPSVPAGTRIVLIDRAIAVWQALERGETQYVADTAEVPGWHDWPPWIGPYRVRSVIVAPLRIDGVLLGSFEVNSYSPNFYTDRHKQIATDFAERATQAFRNARLFAAEQARVQAAEGLASLRSDFVAAVSHELRTPLTAIVGFGELLQARWWQMSEQRRLERIVQIVQAANRQRRLVEDLLLAGQLESAKLRPKCEPCSLGDLVRQAAAEVQGSYPGQTIELDDTCDIYVLADAGRTLQILSNLIDNAAKYSPEGTPIVVRWVEEECMAVLRVDDLGAGVPDGGRDKLFTRFGRLPGSAIRSGRVGTGLGLFLSRGLAEAMGGTLDLEATGPEGSIFRLRLPRATAVPAIAVYA